MATYTILNDTYCDFLCTKYMRLDSWIELRKIYGKINQSEKYYMLQNATKNANV